MINIDYSAYIAYKYNNIILMLTFLINIDIIHPSRIYSTNSIKLELNPV